jgi:hypothetical protein
MNADTAIDLEALMEAVVARIRAAFPSFVTVNDFDALRTGLALPACLITLEDFEAEPEADPLTGQLALLVRWRARVVIGFKTPAAKREIRKLAAALGFFIHGQRWGLPVEAAAVTVIAPDDFEPSLDQFEVWSVDFQQMINLGESVWVNDGVIPDVVLSNWTRDGDAPVEGDFDQVVP